MWPGPFGELDDGLARRRVPEGAVELEGPVLRASLHDRRFRPLASSADRVGEDRDRRVERCDVMVGQVLGSHPGARQRRAQLPKPGLDRGDELATVRDIRYPIIGKRLREAVRLNDDARQVRAQRRFTLRNGGVRAGLQRVAQLDAELADRVLVLSERSTEGASPLTGLHLGRATSRGHARQREQRDQREPPAPSTRRNSAA